MNIKELADNILKEWQEEATVLEISKTGSQINRKNPSDLDYLVVCDKFEQRARKYVTEIDGQTYDLMFRSLKALDAQRDFYNTGYIHEDHKLYSYCIPIREPIYGELNYDWNMLNHEEEYLNYIKNRYMNTLAKLKVKTRHAKPFAHYYIILKIYENQSVEINDKMKDDIEIIYQSSEGVKELIEWIEIKLFGEILEGGVK